jgi:hypothetical protein
MLIYLSEAKQAFNLTSRYIDDVQSINNLNLGGKKFKQNMHRRIQSNNRWKSLYRYISIDFYIFCYANYNCTVKR